MCESTACGRPQSIESLCADGALSTASACGEAVCGGAAMTADETGFSMVMTFTKDSYNSIVDGVVQ